MNIIKRIDKCKLNENEKEICQWIKIHLEDIPRMSSRELAKLTYSNPTTILRICKKLGFENFNDFRCQIVLFVENNHEKYKLSRNEDLASMNFKISALHKNIINKIHVELSKDQLQNIYQLIQQYQYIDFVVTENNNTLAYYGADLFFKANKICHVYSQLSKQILFCKNVTQDHLVFMITSQNEKQFIEMVKLLRRKKIISIALTAPDNQLLEMNCDYTIYGIDYQDNQKLKDMIFFISFMYVFNLLTTMLMTYQDL